MKNQIVCTKDVLKKICQFDLGSSQMSQLTNLVLTSDVYQITVEDVALAVKNMSKHTDEEKYLWLICVLDDLYDHLGISKLDSSLDFGFMTDDSIITTVFELLKEIYFEHNENIHIQHVQNEIDTYMKSRHLDYLEREYTFVDVIHFLQYWDGIEDELESGPEACVHFYKIFVDELCKLDHPLGLRLKAYSCFGDGNAAYDGNYKVSEVCFIRLMDLDYDPLYAFKLGYIYFYGKIDGQPDYTKSFKYLTMGACGGVFEAKILLADQFYNGFDVPYDFGSAVNLVKSVYHDTLGFVEHHEYGCSFADAAYRLGNYMKDCGNLWGAYIYYLQAQYTLQERMEHYDHLDDDVLNDKINKAIDKVKEDLDITSIYSTIGECDIESMLGMDFESNRSFICKCRKNKNGCSLTFTPVDSNDILFTMADAQYCEVVKNVKVKVEDIEDLSLASSTFVFDEIKNMTFYQYGKEVATIKGNYIWKKK